MTGHRDGTAGTEERHNKGGRNDGEHNDEAAAMKARTTRQQARSAGMYFARCQPITSSYCKYMVMEVHRSFEIFPSRKPLRSTLVIRVGRVASRR